MKKLINFSLWGDNQIYTTGAYENSILTKRIYGDDWTPRFYYDKSVSQNTIELLNDNGAETILIEHNKNPYYGMFWRFFAAADSDLDVALFRDVDSRLNTKERMAVKEWMESGKKFHSMRDHYEHTVPILGGMWGCRGNILPNIIDIINKWGDFSRKGIDQDFLKCCIWDKYPKSDFFVHDKYLTATLIPGKDGFIYNRLNWAGQHEAHAYPTSYIEWGSHIGDIISNSVL